jgi:hypothetical protein
MLALKKLREMIPTLKLIKVLGKYSKYTDLPNQIL